VPAPFLFNGSPNVIFEKEYQQFVERLASWCREHEVHLLHLAWYGQDWAELNHGREVRALEGYSFDNWLQAHLRLLDIGLKYADGDLAVELPFSGYGPLTEAASRFADHVVSRLGPHNGKFYCQANGWGPRGDWGAPSAETEAAFDRVWEKPICRGQQAIQPSDFPWSVLYEKLYQNRATYCEVYAPSFLGKNREQLADEIRKFAERCDEPSGQPLPKTPKPKGSDAWLGDGNVAAGARMTHRFAAAYDPTLSAPAPTARSYPPRRSRCVGNQRAMRSGSRPSPRE
jgi:hypothetical protein